LRRGPTTLSVLTDVAFRVRPPIDLVDQLTPGVPVRIRAP
jgi:hypothetical protein